MTKPRASTAVDCGECGKTIGRRADLARHMKTHATNREELKYTCPYFGCTYKTLQRSNLATHLNVHSRERPNKCPEDDCDFNTSDPASLTRHRKEVHGYEPKANSGGHPSAIARKAARRNRRTHPYASSSSTSPSSSARSLSPSDTSSPHLQTPSVPDQSSSSSILVANGRKKNGIKNTTAAYSTDMVNKFAQVNGSRTMPPNIEQENSPPTSGLFTTQEAPTAETSQLPLPEQETFGVADVPPQPAPARITSDGFEDFLAQFDSWRTRSAPANTSSSLPAPLAQYTVDDVLAPPPAPLPMPSAQYIVDDVLVPTPPPLPSYEVQYLGNIIMPTPVSLPSYEVFDTLNNAAYSYPTNAASFDEQFSQPLFTAPDMGFYSHPVDQAYLYTAPAAISGFPMQEGYLY